MSAGLFEVPSIFDCPNCRQTIDASAETCRFCGAPVDRDIALKSAALLAKVNQAISEANYMRTVAFSLPVFFGLIFVPFFTFAGVIGLWVIRIVIPVWGIIWWFRYGRLGSQDADYRKAFRTVVIITILVLAILLLSTLA